MDVRRRLPWKTLFFMEISSYTHVSMCRCGCVFFVLLLLDFWLNGRNWAVETIKELWHHIRKKHERDRCHTEVILKWGYFASASVSVTMLILEIPCFGILRSCTRKEHFVRCPSEYKVDAVIQSPTRLHSFLEVTSRSNLQSSTGQVQHRETHEVCHRGTWNPCLIVQLQ